MIRLAATSAFQFSALRGGASSAVDTVANMSEHATEAEERVISYETDAYSVYNEDSYQKVPKPNYGTFGRGMAGDNRGAALKGVGDAKYQVGAYKDIKGVAGLDAHHAGQKAAMKKLVDGYDPKTAPAINVPRIGHTKRHPVRRIVSRSTKGITNARQLLARDIMELRRVYPDIPNSKLQELIEMNKKLYPEMRK